MQILPTTPADFAGANQSVEIQATLLNKAQDFAKQQMETLLGSLPQANLPHQGNGIDLRA